MRPSVISIVHIALCGVLLPAGCGDEKVDPERRAAQAVRPETKLPNPTVEQENDANRPGDQPELSFPESPGKNGNPDEDENSNEDVGALGGEALPASPVFEEQHTPKSRFLELETQLIALRQRMRRAEEPLNALDPKSFIVQVEKVLQLTDELIRGLQAQDLALQAETISFTLKDLVLAGISKELLLLPLPRDILTQRRVPVHRKREIITIRRQQLDMLLMPLQATETPPPPC